MDRQQINDAIVRIAREMDALAELCNYVDYHPDIGRVPEHFEANCLVVELVRKVLEEHVTSSVGNPTNDRGTVIQCPMCADFDPDASCRFCSVISGSVRKDWETCLAVAKTAPNTGMVPMKASTIIAIDRVLVNAVAAQVQQKG
jgi:hypothetical protein